MSESKMSSNIADDASSEGASVPEQKEIDNDDNGSSGPSSAASIASSVAEKFQPPAFFMRMLQSTSKEKLAFGLVMSVAVGLVIPFLGSVGFFDPWESHYNEVARTMAQRDDYLYPYWKNAYFFSKPALLFWTTAFGYKLIGAGDAVGELHWATEWVGRLPMAIISLVTTGVAFFALRRLWSLRAAVFGCIALSTMPFWFLISRQSIPDMLYVGPMSCALLLLAVAFFDDERAEHYEKMRIPKWMNAFFAVCLVPQFVEIARSGAFFNNLANETAIRLTAMTLAAILGFGIVFFLHKKARDPLVHLAAAFVALGTLGKGPHTLAFTGLVLFLYFLTSGEWSKLKRPALLTGIFLYLMISLPWYLTMYFFSGKNGQNKTWFRRFILYDLLGRLAAGAHGERGTFEYYIRYLGFGMFPWSTLAPIAVVKALSKGIGDKLDRTAATRFTHFMALWAVTLFIFFCFTTTKFHHYIFPVVVPTALLIGWFLDQLLLEKKRVAGGVVVAFCFGTLLIARDLATEPWQLTDLFTYHYKGYKPDYYFPEVLPYRVFFLSMGVLASFLVALGALSDAMRTQLRSGVTSTVETISSSINQLLGRKKLLIGSNIVVFCFATAMWARTYDIELWQAQDLGIFLRNVEEVATQLIDSPFYGLFCLGLTLTFGLLSEALRFQIRQAFLATVRIPAELAASLFGSDSSNGHGAVFGWLTGAVVVATLGVYGYFLPLSEHWSHRYLVHTYWSMAEKGEPLIAYQMDWKGETFYAHNQEIQIRKKGAKLKKECQKPGREFILVQTDRFKNIKSALGKEFEGKIKKIDQSSAKWVLVLVEE